MKPILFAPTATDFTSHGIGTLADAISCTVTEERNGSYELELEYPISGQHYVNIEQRSIILAKPSVLQDPQPFRVYQISKPLNGICTINAAHISYDLSGEIINSLNARSLMLAMNALNSASADFTFSADYMSIATMTSYVPTSIRSLLSGNDGSVTDVYGGEWEFDGYHCILHNSRGSDRGVEIRYGKNLTDLTQEENCSAVYTAVCCYWHKEENGQHTCVYGTKQVSDVFPGRTYSFSQTLVVDVTAEYADAPTSAQLETRAGNYIRTNDVGVPTVSLTVSFVMLGQTEEYKDLKLLENVELCDTVTVKFEKLGVDATAKVHKTIYNTLLERYGSIELGDAKSTIADTIASQQHEMDEMDDITVAQMDKAIKSATQKITGNSGGYVVFHDSGSDGLPDEILIMDTPVISRAMHVWRWNSSGLGYSSSGYSGPYELAMTSDGQIVADFITAGGMSANIIKSGELISQKAYVLSYSTTGLTSVDEATYIEEVGQSIQLTYDGSGWVSDGVTYNLSDIGITFQGSPSVGDYITCVYDANGVEVFNLSTAKSSLEFTIGEDSGVPIIMEYGQHGISFRTGGVRYGGIEGLQFFLRRGAPTYSDNIKFYINNSSGKTVGQFWRNSGAQLDASRVIIRDGTDMDTKMAELDVEGGGGICRLNNYDGSERAALDITAGHGRLTVYNNSDNPVAEVTATSNAGAVNIANSNGIATVVLRGSDSSISLGDGTGSSWNVAKYDGAREVYADHFHVYGKSDGLVTSTACDTSECSAYIVYGKPTSSSYPVSMTIPSDVAENYTWQITDDTGYTAFTISNGRATKTGGSGSILGTYAIR